MNEFKYGSIQQLLTEHQHNLSSQTRQGIQRIVEQGTERLNPNTLVKICRDLKCLPTDILRAM